MPPKKNAKKTDPRPKVRGFTWANNDTYQSMSPAAKRTDTKARNKAFDEFRKSQDQDKQLRDIDSGTSEDEQMPDANAPQGSKRRRQSSGATNKGAKMPRYVSPLPAIPGSKDDEE